MKNALAFSLLLFFASPFANAFPEMIRHGYVHCTACHVSPTGGGLLTAYGRSLSKEVLSRWSYEGEEQFLHGALNKTKFANWINSDEDKGFFTGGDFRWIQTHQEDDTQRNRMDFIMQSDLEGAYRWDWGSFGVTYGKQNLEAPDSVVFKPYVLRRWNFLLHRFDTVWLRFALGAPHWGLLTSEHIWSYRDDLGFGPLDRRNLMELENQGEHWGALLGVAESDDTLPRSSRERSSYATADGIIGLNKKIGADFWQGWFDTKYRTLAGGHALWGWSEHWVTLAQYTSQDINAGGAHTWGWYFFQKTTWEFTKGVWASFVTDLSQSDQSLETTQDNKYGVGMQFFPRPHVEIQFNYMRVRDRRVTDAEGDLAFGILHYYL